MLATRPNCPRCQRPHAACLCRWITPTANDVHLLILQHPLERHQAKGSARLLRLSLQRCTVEVGESFAPETLAAWLAPNTWLLYPTDEGAATLAEPGGAPDSRIHSGITPRLVLLDGTWRKTRKLLHCNPFLQRLPRWPLTEPPPSRYAIRKAQRPEQRSTLEAACLALGAIEHQPSRYAPLLAAFDGWIAAAAARVPARASVARA